MAGARKCPQGAGRPVGQRLRPAAQLHYRAESARPRANAAANDSASNGPAGLLNANDSTNVSVGTRAHDATRHADHRAIVRAGRVTDGPGNTRPANVRAGRPTNHLASDNARDTVNGTSHTRAYSIAHTRTDNARAYPLKRSYSRGFTSDR